MYPRNNQRSRILNKSCTGVNARLRTIIKNNLLSIGVSSGAAFINNNRKYLRRKRLISLIYGCLIVYEKYNSLRITSIQQSAFTSVFVTQQKRFLLIFMAAYSGILLRETDDKAVGKIYFRFYLHQSSQRSGRCCVFVCTDINFLSAFFNFHTYNCIQEYFSFPTFSFIKIHIRKHYLIISFCIQSSLYILGFKVNSMN